MTRKQPDRIGELEDELKRRDERIAELRDEVDEMRDLISRMRENLEDGDNVIERWRESFGMEIASVSGSGTNTWTWKPFWEERNTLVDDYNDLVRRFNKYLPRINSGLQNVGRPLAASEAQCITVLKLHKACRSLRDIADETGLGLRTVRTIIDTKNGTDRTMRKRQERIDPNHPTVKAWKRQKRTGASLPQQAQRVHETAQELLTEARGLGRVRAGS